MRIVGAGNDGKQSADVLRGKRAMEYWAKPRMARDQIVLFSPTLDASISDDHPVRLLDELLRGLDWSAWETEYDGRKG